MTKTRKPRTAKTKNGQEVYINTTWKVEGGYEGYVLNNNNHAVLIFIPAN
jgi:hypothetical protein